MRRLVAVAAAAAALLLVAGCGGGGAESTEAATTTAPPVANLRIIFPEGLNVREMGDRVAAVREIAIAKRGVTPRLTRAQYLAAVKRARPPKAFLADWKRGSMEGFLFPALYEFTQYTNGSELVSDQLAAFRKNFAHVNLALRALEEPDAVRRAQDRLDDREGDGGAERAEARRGGDLQPAAPEDAARHRRDAPLRARTSRAPSR